MIYNLWEYRKMPDAIMGKTVSTKEVKEWQKLDWIKSVTPSTANIIHRGMPQPTTTFPRALPTPAAIFTQKHYYVSKGEYAEIRVFC